MTDLRACPVCELEWRGPWTDCPGCLSMAGMKAVSDLQSALASQVDLRAQRIEAAARTVVETFTRDEAQGYRSRDRQYAIEMLSAALASQGAMSPQGDLQRAIQFGQMRGAWMFDHAWTAWEEQEARIARACNVVTA